ncbi:hypothetical protein KQI85_16000, partial [Falcatimonas sp. MSJ-15]|nr:hypothetical protein [Falcatimonas sp. MSJ-15]
MNKFTRSQMGKIMAYALSAAMAVTVVPTYMMKPLTVMADATFTHTQVAQGTKLADGTAANKFLALYSTNSATAKPVFVISPTTIVGTNTYEYYVPYDAPTGIFFYKEVDSEDAAYGDNTGANTSVEITSATPAKGIELPDNMNVYYRESSSALSATNREVIPIKLKGADNASYKSIKVTATPEAGTAVELTTTPSTSGTGAFKLSVNDKKSEIYATVGTLPSTTPSALVADKVTITVEIEVEGRKNPYKEEITLSAVKDDATAITSNDLSVVADNKLVSLDQEVNITATNKNLTSKENVYFVLTSGSTSTSIAQNGVLTLKSGNDVLATYDIDTGKLVTKKEGKYKVVMFVDSSSAAGTPDGTYNANDDTEKSEVEIEAVSFTLGTDNTISGKVGANNVTTNVNANTTATADTITFVEYKVDDTDIASVTGNGKNAAVTLRKAGITKVTAVITCNKENDKVYKFEKSGYIVVAPKDTDDFVITDIDNTELYANELDKSNNLSEELALQLGDAIVNNQVDAVRLTQSAYKKAEDALYKTLDDYNYNLEDESGDVSANGLLFAVYDKDIADADEPDEAAEIKLVVNGVSPKDYQYVQKDSVYDFTADVTVDNVVTELQQPVWLTVKNGPFELNHKYTVYDDGEAIFVAKCTTAGELTFQTDSFSVFSIVEADADAETTDNTAGLDKPDTPDDSEDIYDKVNFSAHVQRRIGTDDEADIAATVSDDGIISLGTHGQSRRVEKITLTGLDADEVEMTAHVQKRVDHPEDVADLTQVVNEDGSISIGTEHQSRRIEAFSMNLKGDLAEKYDVYYRVHAQNYGWLGWAKNGEIAGTSGHSFRLEGIEIIFVEKG